jgi:hypothetical protein
VCQSTFFTHSVQFTTAQVSSPLMTVNLLSLYLVANLSDNDTD